MRHVVHHAIVVTSWSNELLTAAHAYATTTGAAVSPIVPSAVNKTQSFLVAPDGSKSGWDHSDIGDAQREAIVNWLREHRYDDGSSSLEWVEVEYGSDDARARVTRHEWQKRRRAAAAPLQEDQT